MSQLEQIKKDIVKKRSRLYYITHQKEINNKRKQYNRQSWNERTDKFKRIHQPAVQRLLYLLRTNKKATLGEMMAFAKSTRSSIIINLSCLRADGHKIKFCKMDEFYYYGGRK